MGEGAVLDVAEAVQYVEDLVQAVLEVEEVAEVTDLRLKLTRMY